MKVKTNIRAGSGGTTSGGVNSGGVNSNKGVSTDSSSNTSTVVISYIPPVSRCTGI